ncbi:hypothetical protein Bbelb_041130 [Branchiostoma belcheri]|nr:hypothetical protein Bbelb_041130 [Branchiostoma belcheri]
MASSWEENFAMQAAAGVGGALGCAHGDCTRIPPSTGKVPARRKEGAALVEDAGLFGRGKGWRRNSEPLPLPWEDGSMTAKQIPAPLPPEKDSPVLTHTTSSTKQADIRDVEDAGEENDQEVTDRGRHVNGDGEAGMGRDYITDDEEAR